MPLSVSRACPPLRCECECAPQLSCNCPEVPECFTSRAKVDGDDFELLRDLLSRPLFVFSWLLWSGLCVLCGCCRPRVLQHQAALPPISPATSPVPIRPKTLFSDARDLPRSPGTGAADLRPLPRRGRMA